MHMTCTSNHCNYFKTSGDGTDNLVSKWSISSLFAVWMIQVPQTCCQVKAFIKNEFYLQKVYAAYPDIKFITVFLAQFCEIGFMLFISELRLYGQVLKVYTTPGNMKSVCTVHEVYLKRWKKDLFMTGLEVWDYSGTLYRVDLLSH